MKTLTVFFTSLLLATKAHGMFSYKITEAPSDSAFRAQAQILLKQAETLLPSSLKAAIGAPLEVRFASLNSKEGALGFYSQGRLTLDLKTIPEIQKGEAQATSTSRTHKTLYREILATILHETVHAYDRLNLHDSTEKKLIDACREEARNRKENIQSPQCDFYKNMDTTFSENPYFTLSAGFVYDKVSWMKHRSPDTYELTNSSESLAVNMEYFLLDPEFACRRPSLYRLLQSKFQHTPFKTNCHAPVNYLVSDFTSNANPVKSIDPSRIYQVHYLVAGEGTGLASGFGHSMFRLVMCSPKRKVVGPDCLKDLDQHLVLSFRAYVDTPQTSNLKGLKGDYPSRLFIIPFDQAVEEYNRTELRDLRSIPLKMNRQEIERFAVRTAETHWSYDGKYYFASNNCAVEALNLLRTANPGSAYLAVDTITPNGVSRALEQMGVLQTPRYNSRAEAINDGYLFESYRDRYELAFQVLKTSLALPQENFEDFLKVPVLTLRGIYNKLPALPGNLRVKAAAAVLILEKAFQRILIGQVKAELAEAMLENSSTTRTKAEKLAGLEAFFSQPASFIAGAKGYGLPSPQDMELVLKRAADINQQGAALFNELYDAGKNLLAPQHVMNLKNSRDNMEYARGFLHSVL
ncbi:MAG: DUF4105 domain-containing protein [Bdellovibrio sp.]|nr:DUF4105 domain-containing protein [Bdellovibrio sp.]